MGYSTEFEGELKFKTELTASQLSRVNGFCGEDCRDHPEWGLSSLTWVNLELIDDFSGLKWSGSEKSYDMVEKINLIIVNMRKEFPDFGLNGSLLAQGEEIGDIWKLIIGEDGLAYSRDIEVDPAECPHCEKMEKRIKQLEDGLDKMKTHALRFDYATYAVACSDILKGNYIEWKGDNV